MACQQETKWFPRRAQLMAPWEHPREFREQKLPGGGTTERALWSALTELLEMGGWLKGLALERTSSPWRRRDIRPTRATEDFAATRQSHAG